MIQKLMFEIGKTIIIIGGLMVGEKIVHYAKIGYKHQQEVKSWKHALRNAMVSCLTKQGMIDKYDVETDEDDSYIIVKINPKKA